MQKDIIILVDQDGPLANFELGFLEAWRIRFPEEVFVPLERRRTFHVKDDYPINLREKVESIYLEQGFYANLPVTPGSIEAIKDMVNDGLQIAICSAPLSQYEHCVLEKYKWVEKHLGREFTRRIILTKDKTLIRGDVLIDDAPRVEGLKSPVWEQIIFDMPYNRDVTDRCRMSWKTWRQTLEKGR